MIARTAPQVLFEAARREPAHIRLREGDRAISVAQLARRVAGFARYLDGCGIAAGDHVALFGENSVDWIAAALGIQACGAAFVGVHAGSSAELALHVVGHSEAKWVVASSAEMERSGQPRFGIPTIPLRDLPEADFETLPDRSDLAAAACLIYTSGTTGAPKGVVLTHRNLAANGQDWVTVNAALLPEQARELLWLPFSHIFGWGDVCIGTIMGFTSQLATARELPAALVEYRPQILMSVPIMLERLAAAAPDPADLSAALGGEMRLILAGGAALAPGLKRRYREAGVPLLEGYGLSETAPTLTLERPGIERLDTVGAPYPSVEIRLADDGEILARGPSVFAGYWRDPEATAAVLTGDGWFSTGDVGELTTEGFLRIIDRKKEILVLSNGKKIAPQPIEARAAEDPWIARLVVFGNDRPALAVLIDPDLDAIGRDLGRPVDRQQVADADIQAGLRSRIDALSASLSHFERIWGFALTPEPLTVEAGHLTPSFKIRRKAIWEAFGPLIEKIYQSRQGGTP